MPVRFPKFGENISFTVLQKFLSRSLRKVSKANIYRKFMDFPDSPESLLSFFGQALNFLEMLGLKTFFQGFECKVSETIGNTNIS